MSSITVEDQTGIEIIEYHSGQTLLSLLRENGYRISAPCGGNGTCGNCKLWIMLQGNRQQVIACKTEPKDGMKVFISDTSMHISEDFFLNSEYYPSDGKGFGFSVDLGTTTVAIRLIDLSTGKILASSAAPNSQCTYGADVISRIQYTIDHPCGLQELGKRILDQINSACMTICNKIGVDFVRLPVLIAGNTTMQHIAAGIDPRSIAVYPFIPLSLFEKISLEDKLSFVPCISGYIGGDIVADIVATGLHHSPNPVLLIDLGTNGEIVLGSRNGLYACSVACGPAFEGAGISCGCPGIDGAVCHVKLCDKDLNLETVNGMQPVGICGSGILDLVAALLDNEILDPSGYLQSPEDTGTEPTWYHDCDSDGNGIIFLTKDHKLFFSSQDVRHIQTAKAAIAAGIRVLLKKTGITMDAIDSIYLAGGFGTALNPGSAVRLGLLPTFDIRRIRGIGNSSLAGACIILSSSKARKELGSIISMCNYVELSGDPDFNRYFVDEMSF